MIRILFSVNLGQYQTLLSDGALVNSVRADLQISVQDGVRIRISELSVTTPDWRSTM